MPATTPTLIELDNSRDFSLAESFAETSTYTEKHKAVHCADEDEAGQIVDDYIFDNDKWGFTKFDKNFILAKRQFKVVKAPNLDVWYDVTLIWNSVTGGGSSGEDPQDGPIKDGRIQFDVSTESLRTYWSNQADTSGGAVVIDFWTKRYPDMSFNSDLSPDLGGAIEFDGDEIKGVDVLVPRSTFSEKYTLKEETVIQNWRAWQTELVTSTNKTQFRGRYEEDECLCLGIIGRPNGNRHYDVEFTFGISPETSYYYGDNPLNTGTDLEVQIPGWHYAWFRYESIVDDAVTYRPVRPKVVGVYVHRLYRQSDFDVLVPNTDET